MEINNLASWLKCRRVAKAYFFLEGSPKLMYFADSLAVVYDKQQLNFSLKDLKDYHFEERDATGIGKVVDQNKAQRRNQLRARFSPLHAVSCRHEDYRLYEQWPSSGKGYHR